MIKLGAPMQPAGKVHLEPCNRLIMILDIIRNIIHSIKYHKL